MAGKRGESEKRLVVSIKEDDFEWHAIYSGQDDMHLAKKCQQELHQHARTLLEKGYSIDYIFLTFDEQCTHFYYEAAFVVILFKFKDEWYHVQLGLCTMMQNDKNPTRPHIPFYDGHLLEWKGAMELKKMSDAMHLYPEQVWLHNGKIDGFMPSTRCFGAFFLKKKNAVWSTPIWGQCNEAKFVVLATDNLFETVPIHFIQKFVKTRLDLGDDCETIAKDLTFLVHCLSYERESATVVVVCMEQRKPPTPEEPLSGKLLQYIEKRKGISLFSRKYDLTDFVRDAVFLKDNVDELVDKFGHVKKIDFRAML